MDHSTFMRTAANKFGPLGRGFMMNPYAGERGEAVGLNFFEFYALGRAGVLGDVDAKTVVDALFFFNPELVAGVWDAAKEKMSPDDAVKHYADACADWGRNTLADVPELESFTAIADRVVAAAEPTPSSVLFAGWRDVALPADPPGRAALQVTLVLREHRGGAHVEAVKQVGLAPVDAIAVNSPHMLQLFGWPKDPPDTVPFKERVAKAEDITDELASPAYAGLDDDERATFARVIEAIGTKLGA